MPTPDVSFIISLYKPNLIFLREMIESVVKCCRLASGISCEVLISSDGSPDDAAKYAEQFAHEFPDLVFEYNSPVNRGIGNARCFLAEHSRGRYIASFDQDDILLPFDLAGAVKFLDEHQEYAASYARKFLFNDRGLTGIAHGGQISRFTAFFSPKININAMLIRREELIAHQSFMPCPGSPINDDVYLMMRLQYDRDIYFDSETPRCLYRCHSGQNRFSDKEDDFVVMGQAMIARAPELYQKIIDGGIPEETPENFRAVQGFFGLAAYLTQKDKKSLCYFTEVAVRLHPEDHGAWEHKLIANIKNSGFIDIFDQACERFSDNLEALSVFYNWMYVYKKLRNQSFPAECAEKAKKVVRELFAIPDIVRNNLPPSVKKNQGRISYSFVPDKLEI